MSHSPDRLEMPIPWPGYFTAIFILLILLTFSFGTLVAALSILLHAFYFTFSTHLLVSAIWLAVMAFFAWVWRTQEGSSYNCFIGILSVFSRRHFTERVIDTTGTSIIQFGFQQFGRRLIYFRVPINKIEKVYWRPGQNPEYWVILIQYLYDDLETNLVKYEHPESKHNLFRVGPAEFKEKTEALGLVFVDFLRRAGVSLIKGEEDGTYVRDLKTEGDVNEDDGG